MAESDALSYWPITIVHESKLLHMATVHYGFVPKLSHHGGKTEKTKLRTTKVVILVFRLAKPMVLPSEGLNPR